MASCTIFRNFEPAEAKSLIQIGNEIKSGKYKAEIEEFRSLFQQGKKEEAALKKKQLVAFSPSVILKDSRHIENIEQYSGYVHLDFDKLSIDKLKSTFKVITEIPYTFMCFISPSGKGLKVFIELNSKMEDHDFAYQVVKKYYEEATGLKADNRCKDIARLCFMSYDPDLYKNISNEKFIIKITDVPSTPVMSSFKAEPDVNAEVDLNITMQFQQQVEFTNRKLEYVDGDRNNYIYSLASNCNRAGITQESTTELSLLNFDLPESEIRASVQSAYKNHTHEFGKFAKVAKSAIARGSQPPLIGGAQHDEEISQEKEITDDCLRSTPMIPDEVCNRLPSILRNGAKVFPDKRKRDVFITAALAILSGCLPKVVGVYFQERVYPHLYSLIVAPAASGKGALKNAKRLAGDYHDQVLKQSKEAMKKYEAELLEYNNIKRKQKPGSPFLEPPEKPPFKIVFIPADCSQARMVEHLKNNGGRGIICETEADIMSGAKKQDWGDYSPILRVGFHHEKYSYSRKGNDEFIEIDEPCIALALSGTPGQVPKLIYSVEDGLFSRILFYAFKSSISWQDPSPRANPIVFNDHFGQLAEEVLKLTKHLDQFPTEVHLTDGQWDLLNSSFKNILDDVVVFSTEEAAAIVYRLGLILFRFCMVFTALRKFEAGNMKKDCYCTDEDFDSGLSLAKMYLHHSLLMFNNLPNQQEVAPYLDGENKRKFFEKLPEEFQRKDAVKLGLEKFHLSIRSVDEILKLALNKKLQKLKAGLYCKID